MRHFRGYFVKATSVVLVSCLLGTIAYMVFEKQSFFDSLYTALSVVSTLGVSHPETTRVGRLVTMLLIVTGTGGVAFLVSAIASSIVAKEIKTVLGKGNMKDIISKMKDHIIICGFGRMGRQICEDLKKQKSDFVVVESSPVQLEHTMKLGIPHIVGYAHEEDVLKQAGIDRARGLVSVLTTDADNIYVVLTARGLNPELHIIVRTEDEATIPKMRRAGANVVVSPFTSGAKQIAVMMTNPAVAEFFDEATQGENLEINELVVPVDGCLIGRTLGQTGLRERCGTIVVSIKRKDGVQVAAPPSTFEIKAGDRLLCIGAKGSKDRIESMMAEMKKNPC